MLDLTIIVPVYNVEKYLKKCIDSILEQTYTDFELLLIDDGSTDTSPKICDEYAKKDKRVKVIHQKNSGLSGARNKGIENSNGKYLLFIDSDDYIDLDYFEKLMTVATEEVDIVISGKYYEDSNYNLLKKTGEIKPGYISKEETLEKMLTFNEIDTSFCDKLFNRKLFNNILFPVGRYYEDLATAYKVIEISTKIYILGCPKYHYILRENSITNSSFGKKNLDMINFSFELYNYIIENHGDLKPSADVFLCYQLSRILQDLYLYDKEKQYQKEKKQYKKQYNTVLKESLFNRKIPFKKKILLILIYFNLYKIVFMFKSR